MKITRMDLVGQDQRGNNIFAVLTRKLGSEYIEVEILSPAGTRRHHVLANDADDQFSLAQCLQEQLDGCRGTNSMVNDYYRLIQMLGDC